MEEPRADAGESPNDPLGRLAKRLLDSSLDDVDLEEPSAPAIEGSGSPLPPALLRLRDYTVIRCLGRGGMGAVYLAHQRSLPDKQVALKVLPGIFATDPVLLARFRNEASTASRLNHPGVVAVLDIQHENDVHFQVQELVEDGRTLWDLIREARDARTLPKDWFRTAAELFAKIAEALAAVHAAHVLHRDIKPANILLTPQGEPKVGDFGLAKDTEAVGGVTLSGSPGTLNYKSPEQLDKGFGEVDQRSDVFSLGVTMYEALTLTRLFPGDKQAEVQPAILGREVEDLRLVRPGVPKDLSTLCRKCLEKRPEKRYQTMAEVAADLRRYLGNEPILAKEPSRWERVWKWSRRNPGVATGIGVGAVALVVISVVALVAVQLADEKALLATEALEQKGKAETNATLANDKAAEALREKGRADAKVRDFNQLAGVERLRAVLAKQVQLWPAWPDQAEAMQRWLGEDCGELLAMEPEIRRTVDELRSQALPLTPEQIDADRRSHPRLAEFHLLQNQVASLRYAQAIRSGAPLIVPELSPAQQAMDSEALNNEVAWPRVAPKPEDRDVWGEEALGLAAARAAVVRAGSADEAYPYLDSLAWALLANGQDAEARARSAEALEAAPRDDKTEYAEYQRDIGRAIDEATAILEQSEVELAKLMPKIDERRTWVFEATPDGDAARFLHDSLTVLLGRLSCLATKEMADVALRLRWAKAVQAATHAHPLAKVTWAKAREAIAKADGTVASTLYAGITISLPDDAVIGLVPIGMNPKTKLWEFYDLRSAWDGKQGLHEIPIPIHKADGSVAVTGTTGIVFVLLPGGTVTLGSQSDDRDAPYYDPQHKDDEMLHTVPLAPFLLARHELTQGQWSRLCSDEEWRSPSCFMSGEKELGKWITLAHPVEQVSWELSNTLMAQHGMQLPSEAQWEYGCRGGTTTPWIVAIEELSTVANFANMSAMQAATMDNCERASEASVSNAHVPVGSLAPNAFGLFDMHGNVMEWCNDIYGYYDASDYSGDLPGDGLRPSPVAGFRYRCLRGGAFGLPAALVRSAYRTMSAPEVRLSSLGLRPARRIT